MTHLSFEEITEDDLKDLRSISIKTFKQTFAAQNSSENVSLYLRNKMSIKQLKQEVCDTNSKFYFIKKKNKIIGYTKLNFKGSQREKMYIDNGFEIERIYLITEYQGVGVGKKILTKIFKIGKERGYEKLWLGVWEKNFKAINFYKKNGFKKFGKYNFLLGNDIQTDYLMEIDI